MPHIKIEYTSNVEDKADISSLMQSMHEITAQHYDGDPNRIKLRTYKIDQAHVGTHGSTGSMVHITLLLIEGKSDQNKKEMGQALYDHVCKIYGPDNDGFQVSLEIRDMSSNFYFK